ncbi:hypothetical protein Fcan01_16622 [Folsomia candida]|uniref:Uncharacterized protein n=1 Tax=Folsomia candida TaxID=158441 RepID=A0A226DSS3_FOLCA|nr:hypothetical protein Fcan01_16622 [Folsomia candida]
MVSRLQTFYFFVTFSHLTNPSRSETCLFNHKIYTKLQTFEDFNKPARISESACPELNLITQQQSIQKLNPYTTRYYTFYMIISIYSDNVTSTGIILQNLQPFSQERDFVLIFIPNRTSSFEIHEYNSVQIFVPNLAIKLNSRNCKIMIRCHFCEDHNFWHILDTRKSSSKSEFLDMVHTFQHFNKKTVTFGKPVLIDFSRKYTNWFLSLEKSALRPHAQVGTNFVIFGAFLKVVNMTPLSPQELDLIAEESPSINKKHVLRLNLDYTLFPTDSSEKHYSIAETFNNDVVYIYCETRTRLSQNLGVGIFFLPFQTVVWIIIGVFLTIILLLYRQFWRACDFILLLAGIPPSDTWWKQKSVPGSIFLLGFLYLNSLYVCYVTTDVTAALFPERIATNRELFMEFGYKIFLPKEPEGNLSGRIQAYFERENDREEFKRCKIPISRDRFIQEHCPHEDSLDCVRSNPGLGAARILKKFSKIMINTIKRGENGDKIHCNIVRQVWTKVWQMWQFVGADATFGLKKFMGLEVMGLVRFWEGVYREVSMRKNKVTVETKAEEMIKFSPLKLDSNIFVVFCTLVVFLGGCVAMFGLEIFERKRGIHIFLGCDLFCGDIRSRKC